MQMDSLQAYKHKRHCRLEVISMRWFIDLLTSKRSFVRIDYTERKQLLSDEGRCEHELKPVYYVIFPRNGGIVSHLE